MTRATNARLAGFMFLFYIATGIAGIVLLTQASKGGEIGTRLDDPGGAWRRAYHAVRCASRRAAPGAPSVADALRAFHCGRIVFLDPRARGGNPAGAIHESPDAHAADPPDLWRDVLLAVEGPRPSHLASGRRTRFDATPYSRGVNANEPAATNGQSAIADNFSYSKMVTIIPPLFR